MAETTHIEWTDATWNPVTGCSVVSPGCTNCYAMRLAGTRLQYHWSRIHLTQPSKAGPVWTGEVRFNEEWLTQPLKWRRPRKIFVCAHGDLFHESIPDEWIDRVFAVMALAPQHIFQVLTKRSARMRAYFASAHHYKPPVGAIAELYTEHPDIARWFPFTAKRAIAVGSAAWPLPNVWLGVSVEDQTRADERIPDLLATPAAIRFVSAEPLLGPVDLTGVEVNSGNDEMDALNPINISAEWQQWCDGLADPNADGDPEVLAGFVEQYGRVPDGKPIHPTLDWVIAGGESGPGARPMHPDWARSLRDKCAAAGVPFFFKQWGEWIPAISQDEGNWVRHPVKVLPGQEMWCAGKKRAGRLLDGSEHNAMPAVHHG